MFAMSNHLCDVQDETCKSTTCGAAGNSCSTPKIAKSQVKQRSKGADQNGFVLCNEYQNGHDHKVKAGNERLDLLGSMILTGRLAPDKKTLRENVKRVEVTAKLTTKEFVWATKCLKLEDIVAVSYSTGTRRFTVHSFPLAKSSWISKKVCRQRMDKHFLAPDLTEALKWVQAFECQRCFVNCSPHPLLSSKRHGSIVDARDSPPDVTLPHQPGRVMLVVLNPRSGRGCARKIYDSKVEPILKLAGVKLNVVETTGPHHAQKLAATVDLSTCIDGIICVGGDGIINEVLNGLISREDSKQSSKVPIGIIPAGSDNSLIWTVLGIRDPSSAAVAIVKGELVSMDIFSVEWMKTGDVHMGLSVAYYGFMSDVLELSETYQKRFGPLRYFVAGIRKFLCLQGYECEVEYLPATSPYPRELSEKNKRVHTDSPKKAFDELGENFDRKIDIEAGVRMANNGFPSHDSVLMGSFKLSSEHDILTGGSSDASNEPSGYVRGLDTKSKRLPPSMSRGSAQVLGTEEAIAVNHSVVGPTTPSPRPRTRSKSRIERGWSGMSSTNGSSRTSWDYAAVDCHGDVHSGLGDEISKAFGVKWALQQDTCLDVKVSSEDDGQQARGVAEDEKWVVKQGPFLGVMVCNHQCKTVQCLETQALAPTAEHDDRTLDLVIVRKVGRFQLLRFLILLQFGRHLSLPFVEYTKVRSVKLKPGNNNHNGCGIDGELLPLSGPISTTLLDEQCHLIGFSTTHQK